MFMRLTSLEDPSLKCTSEGDEVTDAVGALITTMYRSKKAEFSATNSLYSFDLATLQYGGTKEIASSENKMLDYTYDILEVNEGSITLSHKPKNPVKYIYAMASGEIATAYEATASDVDTTHFKIEGDKITVPTGLTGKVYVEYDYETEKAMRVVNKASDFPKSCSIRVYVYFKDKCNDNLTYSGKIICPKAKIDPSQIETALTSTGKHPFTFQMMKDYCSEEDELFTIIVSE